MASLLAVSLPGCPVCPGMLSMVHFFNVESSFKIHRCSFAPLIFPLSIRFTLWNTSSSLKKRKIQQKNVKLEVAKNINPIDTFYEEATITMHKTNFD